jgi:tRNA G18 (ribose-2'-O)-methylase SpoU
LPTLIPITDPTDPRVRAYRDVRERDVAGRENGFIAEGEVVMRVLARSPLYRAESLMIAENRIDRASDLIAAFGDGPPVYVASQQVMDGVVGFNIHRGLLAFGRRGDLPSAEALLARQAGGGLVLALFGISNHDNIGGIFRNAAAFGAGAVLLDGACCDPLYRKAIRVSVGGALTVPFARTGAAEDAPALLSRHGYEILALSPAGATPLASLRPSSRTAVLLGAEGQGLPQTILEKAKTVRIPMAGGFDSLNVAVTSGIVLHHLAQEAGARV